MQPKMFPFGAGLGPLGLSSRPNDEKVPSHPVEQTKPDVVYRVHRSF